MKFSIKDFFCKCDQIRRKLRIVSHLLKKSLLENFIFCAVQQEMIIIIYKSDYLRRSWNFIKMIFLYEHCTS